MVWIELSWKLKILVSWNKFVKCKELKDWFRMYDFEMLWFSKCNYFKYFGFERVITLKVLWFLKGEYMLEMEIISYWFGYSFEIKMVLVSKYKLFWKKYSLKRNDLIFLKYNLFWNDHGVIITFGC